MGPFLKPPSSGLVFTVLGPDVSPLNPLGVFLDMFWALLGFDYPNRSNQSKARLRRGLEQMGRAGRGPSPM